MLLQIFPMACHFHRAENESHQHTYRRSSMQSISIVAGNSFARGGRETRYSFTQDSRGNKRRKLRFDGGVNAGRWAMASAFIDVGRRGRAGMVPIARLALAVELCIIIVIIDASFNKIWLVKYLLPQDISNVKNNECWHDISLFNALNDIDNIK